MDSLSAQDFLGRLEKCGLLPADEVSALSQNADLTSLNANDVSQKLVEQNKLTPFQSEMLELDKGQQLVLGNYVLLSRIGKGGMGEVFKAMHRRMERIVALKILPAAVTEDSTAVSRFAREVRAAAKLTHPNIVTAYDADEAKGVHFFVMEFVDGSDLSVWVKRQGVFPVEQAANFTLQAARGLKYAHEKGIIHRDIKPHNLLVDSEGTIKILDMGLARFEDPASLDAQAQEQLTNTGTVMGTVDYMSPEQALDTKQADARSDIYSLGCTLCYLLTGGAMYQADTLIKKVLAHREQPIPSLVENRPEVPVELDAVFQKMVTKDSANRYQSMAEVIVAIQACGIATVSGQIFSEGSSSGSISSSSSPTKIIEDSALDEFLKVQSVEQTPTIVVDGDSTDHQETVISQEFGNTVLSQADGASKLERQKPLTRVTTIVAGFMAVSMLLAVFTWVFWGKENQPSQLEKIQITKTAQTIELPVENSSLITTPTFSGEKKQNQPLPVDGKSSHASLPNKSNDLTPRPIKALVKTPSTPIEPLTNSALHFDDTSQVSIPTLKIGSPSAITIEAIVKPKLAHHGMIVSDAEFGGLGLKILNDRWEFDGYGVVQRFDIPSDQPVDFSRWTHVAAVIGEQQAELFVNGRLQKTIARLDKLKPSKLPVAIGANPDKKGSRDHFQGMMRAVRISKTARYVDSFEPPNTFRSDKQTLALYLFGTGSGEVLIDSSGNDHHGKIIKPNWVSVSTIIKPPSQTHSKPSGKPKRKQSANKALSFNGKDNYIEVPKLPWDGQSDITVEAIVSARAFESGKEKTILSLAGSQTQLTLGSFGGDLWAANVVNAKERRNAMAKEAELNQRFHLAAVLKDGVPKLFVNGRVFNSYGTARGSESENGVQGLVIGGTLEKPGSVINAFDGLIDEVRISKGARYQKEFTPAERFEPDEQTLALYHFDSGQSDMLFDISGNGLNGRIFGAKWVSAAGLQQKTVDVLAADRKVADWTLKLGGIVQILDSKQQQIEIKSLGDLPERFTLVGISLNGNPRIADRLLGSLPVSPNLHSIHLNQTDIGNAGLKRLALQPNLIELSLSETQVSSDGLRELRRFTTLQILNLAETKVTDAGVVHLDSLKDLRLLKLQGAAVTAAGAKAVHDYFPACTITYGPAKSPVTLKGN